MAAFMKTPGEMKLDEFYENTAGPWPAGVPSWTVLGLECNATRVEVNRAVRKLAGTHHPDKNNGDDRAYRRIALASDVMLLKYGPPRSTFEFEPPPVSEVPASAQGIVDAMLEEEQARSDEQARKEQARAEEPPRSRPRFVEEEMVGVDHDDEGFPFPVHENDEPRRFEETMPVSASYTHIRAHETKAKLVCRFLLEKKK